MECHLFLKSPGSDKQISDECLKGCKEFIRRVLYNGNPGESYLETRIQIYVNQPISSKSTLTIPPDEDSCTQLILRSHFQAYIWSHYNEYIIPEVNPCDHGWKTDGHG